jgi:hypothetical protein
MKVSVFRDVAPCYMVEVFITLMVQAASISETSVNFYQTTQHRIPEDRHLGKVPDHTNCGARVVVGKCP